MLAFDLGDSHMSKVKNGKCSLLYVFFDNYPCFFLYPDSAFFPLRQVSTKDCNKVVSIGGVHVGIFGMRVDGSGDKIEVQK